MGIPTTRYGKLVTATIRHILEISNSDNSSHICSYFQATFYFLVHFSPTKICHTNMADEQPRYTKTERGKPKLIFGGVIHKTSNFKQ
jgi:hypothetical protein